MAEIRWTEEAHRWLRDIYGYISEDNPDAAWQVVSGIYEKSRVLRSYPEIGYVYRADQRVKSESCSMDTIGLLIC